MADGAATARGLDKLQRGVPALLESGGAGTHSSTFTKEQRFLLLDKQYDYLLDASATIYLFLVENQQLERSS